MDAGGHTEEGQRLLLLTCKAVWAPGSKILQSTSSCCCWNSSSQFTTCTMLQQLLWPLACSRAQQGAQSYCLADGKDTWEVRGGQCHGDHSLGTAEQLPAAQPRTAVSPLSLKEGGAQWDTGFSNPHHPTPLGLPQAQTRLKKNRRGKPLVSTPLPLIFVKKQ